MAKAEKSTTNSKEHATNCFNQIDAALLDCRLSKSAVAVLRHITREYREKKGNAWATDELLAEWCGIKRNAVIKARSKLVELEYVSIIAPGRRGKAGEPGRGTVYGVQWERGAEYVIARNAMRDAALAKRGIHLDTSNTPPPPLATQNCGIHSDTATGQKGIHMDTSDTNCGIQTDTPFNYQNSTTVELQVVDTKDASGWATPTPPHALAAKAGDADGGRYEKLYDAYGTATRYPEGKAAFAALNPSPADFETMILAAARHREWCVADGRATTYRPALPKWITDCHWKEDEPRQGRMVKPKAKATMKADAVAAEKVAAPAPRPAWTMREVVIESATHEHLQVTQEVTVDLTDGERIVIELENPNTKLRYEGRQQLDCLLSATEHDGKSYDLSSMAGRKVRLFKCGSDKRFGHVNHDHELNSYGLAA